ncbi:argininosuccinate lyase [Alkalihalophilus lindianensis]|uniref:Argininosuccinate lyase n=1 Tax=Alkalihalophilus lindianensis TaxID=1630542 RepID=A0ABU3X933_9BACI|nr:argininosuccinate lyase [Alkalihalophilus lindianensis]MDV2684400.1 argininosuccinate lyase [Alkalihalophilus lindianensis]
MKLWGGRFQKEEDQLMEDFNSSLEMDSRLISEDLTGSIAHVKMLFGSNLITSIEKEELLQGLHSILEDVQEHRLTFDGDYEDVHSFVEGHLINRIGETGKKLHTARSRNDQVALDMKLYARNKSLDLLKEIDNLKGTLEDKEKEENVIMPGYTHLQRAQVVTFNYHLRAYASMLGRDAKRIKSALEIMDENPLGCGALAGTTHTIKRDMTTKELGFAQPVENFLDGVSDRDYLIELTSHFSIVMMHLSRLSEELIVWSSQEFGFIQIDDAYATGSSIMPQKKNPDAAELIRGKSGRVYGSLMSLLTIMKGLPLAYNKDMQEAKEPFFDSVDTTISCLKIMNEMIRTLKVNREKMKEAVKAGFLNATEVADYLVNKNVPFRDAHGVVGAIVIYCEEQNKAIEDLSLDELKKISPVVEEDIYEFIMYNNILRKGIKKEMIVES